MDAQQLFNFLILILMMSLLSTSCNHPKEPDSELNYCLEMLLSDLGMVTYDDQELSCEDFIWHYLYEGKDYFLLDNYCMDFECFPFDCARISLCQDNTDELCIRFQERSMRLRILAYKP